MEYNGEGIEALVSVMEDLHGASLIMVDKKLKSLLRCLAFYSEFRQTLTLCNQNFDYETEKKRAFVNINDRHLLRLPKLKKTMVALVSGMLVDFDSGLMDVVTFAGQYYPAASKQESYQLFYEKVLEPFKLALVDMVVSGVEDEAPEPERIIEFASQGLQKQTEYLLIAFVKAVQETNVDDGIRAELMLMLEGYAVALDSRDTLMIRAMWLGVKNALASSKLCPREIDKMDETLKLFLVVK